MSDFTNKRVWFSNMKPGNEWEILFGTCLEEMTVEYELECLIEFETAHGTRVRTWRPKTKVKLDAQACECHA